MGRPKGSKNTKTKVSGKTKTKTENVTPENDGTRFIPDENSGDAGNVVELKFDEGNPSDSSETKDESPDEKISNIMNEFSTEATPPAEQPEQLRTRKPRAKKGEPEQTKLKIPAKLFIKVHNKALVGVVQFADRFSKKPIPMEYIDHVGLSKDDMNDEDFILAAEECIKAMKIESNPIAAFYISFGMMAVTNYMTLKAFLREKGKESEPNNVQM